MVILIWMGKFDVLVFLVCRVIGECLVEDLCWLDFDEIYCVVFEGIKKV